MSLVREKATPDRIWNHRHFLHPNMRMLGNHERAITPIDFTAKVRNRFFPLTTDITKVEHEFVSAMNRGARTLNLLLTEHLHGQDAQLVGELMVGEFPEHTSLPHLIAEARGRYRALVESHTSDQRNKRPLYEVIRAIELGHQILVIDTEREVQSSLRHYEAVMEWFNDFLGIPPGVPHNVDDFDHTFATGIGVTIYGHETPFKSRLKCLTPEGKIKYASLLMKEYLDFLESSSKKKNGTRDYTGIEIVVSTDRDVGLFVDGFRSTSPTGTLEGFKQRPRTGTVSDNADSSSAFGLTKFIFRVPIMVDPIDGHPLGNLMCQRIPVELQILTLEDYHIRSTHPDARHESYKQRQFMRLFPALFPRDIYAPFLSITRFSF